MGLFETFNKVSHQDWLDKISIDLKGKDFKETLVWNSKEGISVYPFYNGESNIISSTPLRTKNSWEIRETIIIDSVENANTLALKALKGGANSIQFVGEINNQIEMDALLKDIQIDIIETHFYNNEPNNTSDLISIKQGSISADYLNSNVNENIEKLHKLITSVDSIKTITIVSNRRSKGEHSIIRELAFSMSQAVEYLNLLTDKGISANKIAHSMQFNFKTGANYFFEIAKIRAARKLWKLIIEQFQISSAPMFIHCETTMSTDTGEDKNYNILRNTTKAMSAILGGCDSLSILPHDSSSSKTEFSNRIARNIQLILKEESFFDKVNNPADGAYYIEYLTEEIAKKSWLLFQQIESNGGYLACAKKDFDKINA